MITEGAGTPRPFCLLKMKTESPIAAVPPHRIRPALKSIAWILLAAGVVWFAAVHRQKFASDAPSASVSAPKNDEVKTANTVEPSRSFRHGQHESTAQLVEQIRQQLNSGESGRELVLTNLLLRLIAIDPNAAARLAESIEAGAGREEMLRTVAQEWKDSAGVLAWTAQLPDSAEQQTTLANVILQMASSDPAQAIEAARQYLSDKGEDLLPSLAVQWADKDLTAALAWAESLPAGDQRNELMARIAFVESQSAPAAAGARVLAELPPGPVQEEAVLTVIHQWSLKDLAGAWGWVQRFPEIPLKQRALAEVAVVANYPGQK